ncbi:MAG: hypothetical protein QOG15_2349 [Solirubrobacteraceae bacterium]|jgi:hypothetical protein|nr:hypothetical protein [Solirubrobacteraceae bacterium]
MAPRPKREPQPRARRTYTAGTFTPGKRETSDERRVRQLAIAVDAQSELKREAAERRAARSAE